ncbi:MAG TPA: hypothetical protein PLD47_12200 [Aggregatilineales bacterium]|nr:hypothetical protein [Anaerolineales bacterium]HRE48478.1 hypothetical protein [Aggregatilineales bacterium]
MNDRPLWIAVLLGGASLALWIGVWGAVQDAPLYPTLSSAFPLWGRLTFNAGWGSVLGITCYGYLWRRRWGLRVTAPFLTGYAFSGLLLTAPFLRADYDRTLVGFHLALSSLLLIPLWWVTLRRGWLSGSAHR